MEAPLKQGTPAQDLILDTNESKRLAAN